MSKCSARVPHDHRPASRCENIPKVVTHGKVWCSAHDPSTLFPKRVAVLRAKEIKMNVKNRHYGVGSVSVIDDMREVIQTLLYVLGEVTDANDYYEEEVLEARRVLCEIRAESVAFSA